MKTYACIADISLSQKADLRTFRALLSPQDYYFSNSDNSTSLNHLPGDMVHRDITVAILAWSRELETLGPPPEDKGWGGTRASSCLCARLNPSFQASQNLGTAPDIYFTVLHNVLVLIRSS